MAPGERRNSAGLALYECAMHRQQTDSQVPWNEKPGVPEAVGTSQVPSLSGGKGRQERKMEEVTGRESTQRKALR